MIGMRDPLIYDNLSYINVNKIPLVGNRRFGICRTSADHKICKIPPLDKEAFLINL